MPAVLSMIAIFIPQAWVLQGWKISLDGGSAGVYSSVCSDGWHGPVMFVIGARMFRKRFA
jgi:hypothetical protein